ncbi:hypothetical protein ACVFYP_07445 [Roseomonas sp. F4]
MTEMRRQRGQGAVTPWEIREQMKALAQAGAPADCAEIILLMHYERSREGWEGNGWLAAHGRHPDWPRFAAARVAQANFAAHDPAVAEELRRRYPPEVSWCLPDGMTQWRPATVPRTR